MNEAAYTQPATDSPMTMQQAWTTALLRRDLRVWMRLCLLVRLAARPQAGAGGGTRDGATGGLLLQPRAARQLMTVSIFCDVDQCGPNWLYMLAMIQVRKDGHVWYQGYLGAEAERLFVCLTCHTL